VRLFAGEDYSSICAFVNYRVKKLAYNCIRAVHHNRFALFILIHLLLLFVECHFLIILTLELYRMKNLLHNKYIYIYIYMQERYGYNQH
jgi:hypothetical protein